MKNIKSADFEEKTEPTITAEDCEIQDFDGSEFLKEEHYALHLQISFEEDGIRGLLRALGEVARAKSMTELSKQTGICRQHLYRALSEHGNPSVETLIKILEAFNLKLRVDRI